MAYTSGQGGSIGVGASTLCIKKWTLNDIYELADTTSSCSGGSRTKFPVIKDWNFSAEGNFDAANAPSAVITKGSEVAVVLNVGGSGKTYSGNALVTKITIENVSDGMVNFTIECEGTGALTGPA